MSVCSQVKGRINSFLISLSRGASCRLWLLSQQPQIQGPGGTPSHQEWRLSHPAGSLGTALWLAGSWEYPLSWGPSLAMVSDSCEGGLCQHKDIMRCLRPALGERGFPRWLRWQRIHLPMQETQETWVQSLSKIHWKRSWQPTPIFLPGKFHEQRSLAGYNSWGHKESDMTKHAHTWGNKKMRFPESALPNCANTIDSSLSFPGTKWSQLHNNSSSENSLSFGELEGWFLHRRLFDETAVLSPLPLHVGRAKGRDWGQRCQAVSVTPAIGTVAPILVTFLHCSALGRFSQQKTSHRQLPESESQSPGSRVLLISDHFPGSGSNGSGRTFSEELQEKMQAGEELWTIPSNPNEKDTL